MSLSLEVEVYGGTPIEIAAHDACVLASELKITVTFDFNGVRCMALPGGDSKTLVHNWNIASDRGGQYPMASTNVRCSTGGRLVRHGPMTIYDSSARTLKGNFTMEQLAETYAPDPDLKPCPFCGAHAWMHISPSAFAPSTGIGYRIECEGLCHAMTCWWHKRAQAVKAWNMRSAHSASEKP